MDNKKKYAVVDCNGTVYGHDLSYAAAEQVMSAQSAGEIESREIEIIEQQ